MGPDAIAVLAAHPVDVVVPFPVTLLGGEAVEAANETGHVDDVADKLLLSPPPLAVRTLSLSPPNINEEASELPRVLSPFCCYGTNYLAFYVPKLPKLGT